MLRLEELEALDLMLWLQSGVTAAAVVGTTQSTICRRAQRAMAGFQAELQRDKRGWCVQTPLAPLLELQRQIHQQWRFKACSRLRLDGPAWSRDALRACLPPGWITTPADGPPVCEQPLELLRSHVIDACLVTPTQLAAQPRHDLALVDLYSSRIDLRLVAASEPETSALDSVQAAQELLLHGRLALPPFLPDSCRDSCRVRFEQLRCDLGLADGPAAAASSRPQAPAPQLAFLTPLMARGLPVQQPLPLPLEWPYRETLVVLRSAAEQPMVQVLVEILRRELPGALQKLVPGGAAPIL